MVTKIIPVIGTLIATQVAQAAYFTPHIGLDYKYWGAKSGAESFADGVSDYPKLFPKISSAGSIYIGTRVNEHFAIDLGYEQSETKHKTATFNNQIRIFGDPESSGDSAIAQVRLKAGFLNTSVYWEAWQCIEFMIFLGIGYLTPDTEINYYKDSGNAFTLETVKSKWIGRGGFGLQYNITPSIGLRGLVQFDGTQRIEYIGNDEDNAPYDINPYKSATSLHAGVVYSFSKPRR